MNYRRFGHTGLKVTPLALGTFNFGFPTPPDESRRIIDQALDAGINLVDTANYYNDGDSERIVGAAIVKSGKRDQIILATKIFFPVGPGPNDRGASRRHIIAACEDSLRRLQTDYIDLLQIHRPDPDTPIDETLGALTDLIRQGKVRYIGCSTHPAWRVMEAILTSELRGYARYVSEQPPYNLLDRRIENELVPLAQAHDLAVIAWGPLAQGVLAGRYADAKAPDADSRAVLRGGVYAERVTRRGVEVGRAFVELARERGVTPAQLALTWVKDQPGITAPIFGPRTAAQLADVLPVLDMRLDDDTRAACDALVPPGTAVADFHNSADWMKMRIPTD